MKIIISEKSKIGLLNLAKKVYSIEDESNFSIEKFIEVLETLLPEKLIVLSLAYGFEIDFKEKELLELSEDILISLKHPARVKKLFEE